MRQTGVGEHHTGQVGSDEPAGVRGASRRERQHAQPKSCQRVETGRRQGDPPQRHRAQKPTAQPDCGANRQFIHQLCRDHPWFEFQRHRAEQQHQDDRRCVVEA